MRDWWTILRRDLDGELVFPLQVVINLGDPDTDYTGGTPGSATRWG